MGRYLNYAVSILSIILATAPVGILLVYQVPVPIHMLIGLNFISWVTVCLLFISQEKMLNSVDRAFTAIGLPTVKGNLETKVNNFLKESGRFHRASYSFANYNSDTEVDLGLHLKRIVELAHNELNAQAAELALYDEESKQWSQALMAGEPLSMNSQSLLVQASNEESGMLDQVEAKVLDQGSTKVIAQPLSFAGNAFGALRVEFPPNIEPTKADYQVAYLLAMQGALMLVDGRFTEELVRMRQTSEETVKAKTGFLANLSHEIRGPLGIILNGIELIIDGLCGPITESQRDTCQMIRKSGEHLLDLVNDVLDYAKVEAGKIIPKPQDLHLAVLLKDMANVVRSQAVAKKHKLVLEKVEESLGIYCDKRHFRQMLINMLTNAVKYTPEGGAITVRAERVPNHRVKISVADTGVGIPDDEKGKVFGAFERVDNQYSLAQQGTGLGMPLTSKLAQVNGGAVDFESEEGEGSTFWLIIPSGEIETTDEDKDTEAKEEGERPQGHGESILLVDHDEEARQMLERYLVHQGFEITNAKSGAEVTKVLREKEIELAVVESDLPDASGEDMISVIRSNPKASTVPIILLSSKAFVFDIERFLKLGVDRCLSKPVELSELAHTVRQLIDEARSLQGDSRVVQEEAPPI